MNLAAMTNEIEIVMRVFDSPDSLLLCVMVMWLLKNNVTLMC